MVTKTVIPADITKLKNESLNKNNNLSDLADRAAAWLNVRPIGSTPLAGDPVNDYDAVTKRWVENKINTGTVGPTMNGVMNYGVGDFHLRDSRAYIQPYEVVSDGQLLNRADWPELWAYAQMVGPISDDVWVSDVRQRGKYSTGDGTTTFRVPDRNGVQLNSIKGLFAHGDGGGDAGQAGSISEAAAPNITGSFPGAIAGAYESAINRYSSRFGLNGAIGAENGLGVGRDGLNKSGTILTPDNTYGFSFDASVADPVYGRYGIKGTIIPNSFIGVWVIRASGGFVAANTSWSVINSDSTRPNASTRASSGKVLAQYKIGESLEAQAEFRSDAYIDGMYYAIMSIYNSTKGVTKELAFDDSGTLNSDRYSARYGTMMAWSQTGLVKGTFSTEEQAIGTNYAFNSILSGSQYSTAGYKTSAHFGLIHNDLGSFADSCWHVSGDADNKYGVRLKIQPNNNSIYFYSWWPNGAATYTLQLNAISDSRLKHDIKPIDAAKSIEVLKGLEFQSFIYNNDEESRIRRGVIAQQVETIEPLYVKTRRFYNDDGVEQEQKELDTTPMLLDTMHVVQDLIKRVEDLEEELKQLRANLVQ
ncbi:tail fiber [Salmonella phage phC17]|uniref:Tail fiber n=1 Tax=Salmonella phage phC17 TaxID=3038310 RepID=A0AAF0GJH8_9CAUD|nr:tail fiber [Salmonella phage phC17]